MTKQVSFTRMDEGTFEDYQMLAELEHDYCAMTADRILAQLAMQAEDTMTGYKITRLEHGLQSAARAEADGADIDWVVAALIHDIGDGLSPQNHDRMAAEIIRPFVREEVSWVVEKHGIFQMKYYGHHYGWDADKREEYRDNPYWHLALIFANGGIKHPLTLITRCLTSIILPRNCVKSLAVRLGMTRISCRGWRKACPRLR